MKRVSERILMAIATFLTVSGLYAQNGEKPAYLNPTLPPQQRAEDLVHRMTVEEMVTQLVNQSREAVVIMQGVTSFGFRHEA